MLLDIQYIGEHLLPGQIGRFAIVFSFVAALLAAAAYFFQVQRPHESGWRQMGRAAFLAHGGAIFLTIGLIFYVMVQHYYEYNYVFAHVNEDLPFQYIFSAFWEGQEGSFLLWMFWHIVLGIVLMLTSKRWESPVMSILSLVQVFLVSMILGLYIGFGDDPMKIGSNPLVLLRDTMQAPIFSNADYLSLIKGSGLNPLLQNYWMTIHPPTLFLGFASTVVPFCFALAGLWTNEHKAWLKPALPWALFSGAILGTGILMGGAWAYEALSFGGYWAWDPVENMSLVPWLTLIAGLHTNLIAKNTGHSIRSTYVFYFLTFALILYSTFLTRSGVLGDTSVHAFTEMGLEWQLILFIAAFLLLSFVPFAVKYKKVPAPVKEESTSSKEFWLFIGSLVLLFSAAMITASTSLPVFNKIMSYFDPGFEGRVITEPIAHYNKYQLWIGVFIGLLTGSVQLLRWKEFNWSKYARKYWTHMGIAIGISAVLTYLGSLWINLYSWQYSVLLFFGIFGVIANLDHLITFVKGNIKTAGSAIAHIGFGLMIVGVLASGLNKHHISSNPFAQRGLLEEERLDRNIMLFEGMPMFMSGYKVTYEGDRFEGNNRIYELNFQELDEESGEVVREFDLSPTALYDNKMTKVAAYNPSTKHYLHKDVFTHIASIPLVEADAEVAREMEDSLRYRLVTLNPDGPNSVFDTITIKGEKVIREYEITAEELLYQPEHPGYEPQEGDLPIGVRLTFTDAARDTSFSVAPMLTLRGSLLYTYPVHLQNMAVKVRVSDLLVDQLFKPEETLEYETFTFKQGETNQFGDFKVRFKGFNKQPNHSGYEPEEDDIAVSAVLEFSKMGDTTVFTAEPVYLIRDSRPFNLKDEVREEGIHIRFTALDPVEESIQLKLAQTEPAAQTIPIEIAYAPRTDFLVLEAIVFPGINFFWLGSVLMMVGLTLGMLHRMRTKMA
jgi:cytochrome c-type biogenesis protein CcmF